ncbi:uncharacterized protein LOC106636737 [Copidosoma floridanum]|uniref:uncharacterized protein LOC106636737 n=1 Tax=Copidosoma floridanum TaxID=29053 RepID=UPI0006C9B614|nr:uncharacterized protein LOC106636737 [Copidosoma floridanum]
MNLYGQLQPLYLLTLLLLVIGIVICDEQVLTAPSKTFDSDVTDLHFFFNSIFGAGETTSWRENQIDKARTFGVKRIQFLLMPLVFKMGVMMTMLVIVTVMSLKGLVIGIILLVLKLSTILGKLFAGLHGQEGYGHSSVSCMQPQFVHVHLHNSGLPVYSGWETASFGDRSPPDDSYYHRG